MHSMDLQNSQEFIDYFKSNTKPKDSQHYCLLKKLKRLQYCRKQPCAVGHLELHLSKFESSFWTTKHGTLQRVISCWLIFAGPICARVHHQTTKTAISSPLVWLQHSVSDCSIPIKVTNLSFAKQVRKFKLMPENLLHTLITVKLQNHQT